MDIVFCADRRMLPGLHVAARSVLDALGETPNRIALHLFSADLTEADAQLLCSTLDRCGKLYSLELRAIDGSRFSGFPELQNSFATYFRLVVPEVLDVDRFLYLDADILCRTDLLPLYQIDLNGQPIGLVPEAPIDGSADPGVALLLGARAHGFYFNAGVMLVDAEMWRIQNVTQRCLEFIQRHQPQYHDQSALNYVLHGAIHSLPAHYNCRTNARENWPALIPPISGQGRLLHFVDFPKPWSALGRWMHPMGKLWWDTLRLTDWGDRATHSIGIVQGVRDLFGRRYAKARKDGLLFRLYAARLLRSVKGME